MKFYVKMGLLVITIVFGVYFLISVCTLFAGFGAEQNPIHIVAPLTGFVFLMTGLVFSTIWAFKWDNTGNDRNYLVLSGSLIVLGIVSIIAVKALNIGIPNNKAVTPTTVQNQTQMQMRTQDQAVNQIQKPLIYNNKFVMTADTFRDRMNAAITGNYAMLGGFDTVVKDGEIIQASPITDKERIIVVSDEATKNIKKIAQEFSNDEAAVAGYYSGIIKRLIDPVTGDDNINEFLDSLGLRNFIVGNNKSYVYNGIQFLTVFENNKTTLIISPVGCGAQTTSSEPKPTKFEMTKRTAEEIIIAMKGNQPNIDQVIVYTAETDVNNKLGRPNQYTSKINFSDKRCKQRDPQNPVGGSIEVFNNEEDCAVRNNYIKETEKQFPIVGAQYMYQYKNVLLRIDQDLTPDQAKEYETVFTDLQTK